MSDQTRRWLEDGSPGIRSLLESAQLDQPTAKQLEGLTARVAFLFPIPPGGGPGPADGGGGGGADPGLGAGPGPGPMPAPVAGGVGGGAVGAGGVVAAVASKGVIASAVSALVIGAVAGTVALTRPPAAPVEPTQAVVAPVAARAVEVVKRAEDAVEPVAEAVATLPAVPVPVPTTAPVSPRRGTSPAAVQLGESPRADEDQPREEPTPEVAPRASESESALELDGEVTLLQRAMGAAQAGDSKEALAHALAHAARYPNSSMAQEREVIAIEALAALGRSEEAEARIASFRMRWPTSTHLLRLERVGR